MYKADEAGCRFDFKILKSGFVVVFYREESSSDVATPQDTPQDTPAVKQTTLRLCEQPRSREELMVACGLKDKKHFVTAYLKPLLEVGQIKMTIPDKPRSKNQKYIRA